MIAEQVARIIADFFIFSLSLMKMSLISIRLLK